MADKTSNVILKYKTDKSSAQETENIAKRLEATLADVPKEAIQKTAELVKQYKDLAQAEGNVEQRARDLNAELRKIGAVDSTIQVATQEFDQMTDSIRRAEDEARRLEDRFDLVSRQVGLAGDVQSNLGAVSGLASMGGATGQRLGQGIGAVGEVVALTEELPRLKTALQGMPSVIKSAVGALGVGGIAGAATLIGGIVALTLVFNELEKQSQLARDRTREGITSLQELSDLRATATEEEIRLEILNRETALESTRLQIQALTGLRTADITRFATTLGGISDFLTEIEENGATPDVMRESLTALLDSMQLPPEIRLAMDDFIATAGEGGISASELNNRIRELMRGSTSLSGEIEILTRDLEAGVFATNTLAQAEAELAQIRTNELLASAQTQAQLMQEIIALNELDAEGLRNRRDELLDNMAVLGAELNVLRESGDASEEVTQRIEELNDALLRNGETISRIDSLLLPSAQAQEALAEAEAERLAVEQNLIASTEQYNADMERMYQERAEIEKRYQDNLIKIAQDAVKASEQALEKLQDKQRELADSFKQGDTDAQDALRQADIDAQVDAQRQERDALRDHLRKLEDIRNRSQDAEFEAILNRDFRALFNIRRGTTRDLNTANAGFTDQRNDQIQAMQDQRQDRLQAFEQERIDRFNAYQLQNAQAFEQYNVELRAIEDRRRQAVLDANTTLKEQQSALQNQLTLRRQAWVREIELAQQGTEAMVKIENQRQQALLMQAQAGLKAMQSQAMAYLGTQTGKNFSGMQNVVNNNQQSNNSASFQFHGVTDSQLTNKVTNVVTRLLGA